MKTLRIECTCRVSEYTRLVARWLSSNEENRQRLEAAAEAIAVSRKKARTLYVAGRTAEETTRSELSRWIHDELWTDEVMTLAGWQGDLLRSALSEVNCSAIAEAYLADRCAEDECACKKSC